MFILWIKKKYGCQYLFHDYRIFLRSFPYCFFFYFPYVSVLFWDPSSVCFGVSVLCWRCFSNVQRSLALCSYLGMGLKIESEALHMGGDWGLVDVTVTRLHRTRLCCWSSLCRFTDFSEGRGAMARAWLAASGCWLQAKQCNQRVHLL